MFGLIYSLCLSLIFCGSIGAMVQEDLVFEQEAAEKKASTLDAIKHYRIIEAARPFDFWRLFDRSPTYDHLEAMKDGVTYGNFYKVRRVLEIYHDIEFDWLLYAEMAVANGYEEMGKLIFDSQALKAIKNNAFNKKQVEVLRSTYQVPKEINQQILDTVEAKVFNINYEKMLTAVDNKQSISNELVSWDVFISLSKLKNIDVRLKNTVLYYLVMEYLDDSNDPILANYWTLELWLCLKKGILLNDVETLTPPQTTPYEGAKVNKDDEKRSLIQKFHAHHQPSDTDLELDSSSQTGDEFVWQAIKLGLDLLVIPLENPRLYNAFDLEGEIRNELVKKLVLLEFNN